MQSPENPEIRKELAKEALRKAANLTLQISEGVMDEDSGNEALAAHQQQYFDLTGEELTPDKITEAIDALPEE